MCSLEFDEITKCDFIHSMWFGYWVVWKTEGWETIIILQCSVLKMKKTMLCSLLRYKNDNNIIWIVRRCFGTIQITLTALKKSYILVKISLLFFRYIGLIYEKISILMVSKLLVFRKCRYTMYTCFIVCITLEKQSIYRNFLLNE